MEKKYFIYSVFVLLNLPFFSNAQAKMTIKNYWYYQVINSENFHKDITQKNLLKAKTILTNKGNKTEMELITYDNDGRVQDYKAKGNREIKINYFKDDLKQQIKVYKKNELVVRDSFSWDNKNLLGCFYFNKENKLVMKESYKYDSAFVTQYLSQKVKNEKFIEKRKRITEYYLDYSIKKITYYKNGKPNYYSVFDCNPIGESHKVKKDSAYNCVKYDVDSLGNKIRVTINNDRSYPHKTIEYFNDKDELVAQKWFLIYKNKLEVAYYYKPGTPYFTKFISYRNKREFYSIENNYDVSNNCLGSTRIKRGKVKEKTINTFNEKNLIETTSISKGRHKKKETKYSYQYSKS